MYHLLNLVQFYSPQFFTAKAGVEYTANGSDNAAAIIIAFIRFLLFCFNFTSPPKYIIQNVIISRINDNDFHYHCQLKNKKFTKRTSLKEVMPFSPDSSLKSFSSHEIRLLLL